MRDATPPGLMQSDFDTIHAAVMETARGRWFLGEYARRHRMADTRMILDAMAKLENAFAVGPVAAAAPAAAEPLAATATQIAERLADIVWDLRERGFADDVCAAVDRQAEAVQGLARRLDDGGTAAALLQPEAAPNTVTPAPAEQILLPAPPVTFGPELRASMHAALAHLDSLPLAARLEMFV